MFDLLKAGPGAAAMCRMWLKTIAPQAVEENLTADTEDKAWELLKTRAKAGGMDIRFLQDPASGGCMILLAPKGAPFLTK